MTTQAAEKLLARRALVKRSAASKKRSPQARRQHGFREPRAAALRYILQLGKLASTLWAELLAGLVGAGYATRQDDDRPQLKQVIDQVRVRLYRTTEEKAPGLAEDAARDVNAHNVKEASRVLGISPFSDSGTSAALQRFRSENVRLIKTIADDQLGRVEKLISENYGLRVEALSEKIQEQFGATKSRAQLIARDQTLKLNGQLTKLRQQGAGIGEYIWTSSGDERVRDDHAALDGTRQSWLVPPVVDERTGRTGHPGDDYQCRCTSYPVIPGLDDTDEGGDE